MPSRGVSGVAVYMAWNTTTNAFVAGDTANHTIRFVKDGVFTTPTNTATEVSGAGILGAYAIAWTSTEGTCNTLWVGGRSSTASVAIIPITLTFQQLPIAAPASAGGLLTFGSSAGQLSTNTGGIADSNVAQWIGSAPAVLINALVQTQVSGAVSSVTGSVGSVSGSVASVTSGVNVTQILGTVVQTSAAQLGVNVVTVGGQTHAPLIGGLVQTQVSGVPGVNVTQWNGSAPNNLVSGRVDASAGALAAGVIVTGSFAAGAITATAADSTFNQGVANTILDSANAIETGITPRQALRYIAAAEAGITTGALTNTFTISAISATGVTRITATTDSSGNRQAVTLS